MPVNTRTFKVILSSPNDVAKERNLVQKNVDELNIILNKVFATNIELIKWETHSQASIGDYGQQVLDKQLLQDYDIFVGILWGRFGSPTSKAGSGTEEEFNLAHKMYLNEKFSKDIKFYFSEMPLSPKDINITQLELLRKFKERIRSLGVYTREYVTLDQFETWIRVDLFLKIFEYIQFTQEKEQKFEVDNQVSDVDNIKSFRDAFKKFKQSFDNLLPIVTEFGTFGYDMALEMGIIVSRYEMNLRTNKNPKMLKRFIKEIRNLFGTKINEGQRILVDLSSRFLVWVNVYTELLFYIVKLKFSNKMDVAQQHLVVILSFRDTLKHNVSIYEEQLLKTNQMISSNKVKEMNKPIIDMADLMKSIITAFKYYDELTKRLEENMNNIIKQIQPQQGL